MRKYGIYTKEQWEWIVDRYAEGYTLPELSRMFDVNVNTIRYHAQCMGIPKRFHNPPLKDRMGEFFALNLDGRPNDNAQNK